MKFFYEGGDDVKGCNRRADTVQMEVGGGAVQRHRAGGGSGGGGGGKRDGVLGTRVAESEFPTRGRGPGRRRRLQKESLKLGAGPVQSVHVSGAERDRSGGQEVHRRHHAVRRRRRQRLREK